MGEVAGFAESDGLRVGGRQLVSQTPRKLAQLKVEVILVWDLARMGGVGLGRLRGARGARRMGRVGRGRWR